MTSASFYVGWTTSGGEPYWLVGQPDVLTAAERGLEQLVDADRWFRGRKGYANATIMVSFGEPDCWPFVGPPGYMGSSGGVIMWKVVVDDDQVGMAWDQVPRFVARHACQALFGIGAQRRIGAPIDSKGGAWDPDRLTQALESSIRKQTAKVDPGPATFNRNESNYSIPLDHPSDEVRILDPRLRGTSIDSFMLNYRQNRYQIPSFITATALRRSQEATLINQACIDQTYLMSADQRFLSIGVIASGKAVVPSISAGLTDGSLISSVFALAPDLSRAPTPPVRSERREPAPPMTLVLTQGTAIAAAETFLDQWELGATTKVVELPESADVDLFLRRERAKLRRRAAAPRIEPPARRARQRPPRT